jgi:hypothetical protein
MMMRILYLAVAVASLAAVQTTAVSVAHASSCQNPYVIQIRIPKGSHCWDYQGTGTHFRGRFGRGQQLQVQMVGPPGAARDVNVTAPNGQLLTGNSQPGGFATILPSSGTYTIGFGPCYLWHSPARVRICAY